MIASAGADSGRRSPRIVRIFESYGWHDAAEVAQRLKDSLTEAGYEVWIDREHLRSDDKHFSLKLEEAIRSCEVVVALMSPHSVRLSGTESDQTSICYNEILFAESNHLPIMPVRVQKFTGMPFLINKYRAIDWLGWSDPNSYHKGVSEIVDTIERILGGEKNHNRDMAFQPLNFTLLLKKREDVFVGRDWLFSRVDAWLESRTQCFLIEGATGNGKTAIVAELVRRNPGGRILAYHFCSANQRELGLVVKSIAAMLASSVEAYFELWFNGRVAEWLNASDPQTMLSQGVLAPLRDVRMDGNFYIIVDALDEAIGAGGDTASRLSLPQLLAAAVGEFPDWLKLLVTTRPHARIQRLFRNAETCRLGGTVEDQRMDLRNYIERRLANDVLRDGVDTDEAARDRAVALIDERSDGSFQYASSIIDALRDGEIGIAQLDQLPHELEKFYYERAHLRFPTPPEFRVPRLVLSLLLAAREALTLRQLATLSGLDQDADIPPALDALSGFVSPDFGAGEEVYRLAHKSITDWLVSGDAGEFKIDLKPGRDHILAYCRAWQTHHEPYALKHLIGHLIEQGAIIDALQAVAQGLFAARLTILGEPRLDAEDSRKLALALIAARDRDGIVGLATTENVWQRDGVAAALQSTAAEDLDFVDGVVAALLAMKE